MSPFSARVLSMARSRSLSRSGSSSRIELMLLEIS